MALAARLGTAAAGFLLLVAIGSLDWRPTRAEQPVRLMTAVGAYEPLKAGAGRTVLRLPDDIALAGYGPFGRAAQEPGTPVHVRSLLLEAGDTRMALVLLEQMTVPSALVEKVQAAATAAGAACTLVVASHSHSGPGGYDTDFLPQLALGRFDERVESAILDGVAASLAAASGDLTPVTLSWAEQETSGLNRNRDHRGAAVDRRLGRLRLSRGDGLAVATLVRFSAHPTLMPRESGPSGDWPGFAMERIEEEGGVAFVLPGTVGDASVTRKASPGDGGVRALLYGELIAEEAQKMAGEAWAGAIPVGCATAEITLPPADIGRMVPRLVGPLASNLVSPWAPQRASLAALRLGPVVFAGLPVEPIYPVSAAIESGWPDADIRVIGATQGYVGYTPQRPAWEAGSPSARNTWFGTALASRIQRGAEVVVAAALEAAKSRPASEVASPGPD